MESCNPSATWTDHVRPIVAHDKDTYETLISAKLATLRATHDAERLAGHTALSDNATRSKLLELWCALSLRLDFLQWVFDATVWLLRLQ